MIDPISKPVRFFDDHSHSKTKQRMVMTKLHFLNNDIAVVTGKWENGTAFPPQADDYIMFSLATGEVLSSNFDNWIAENF